MSVIHHIDVAEEVAKIEAKKKPVRQINTMTAETLEQETNKLKDNKAIELADKMGQFLNPMPSDDEGLIRAAMEFTMQLDPGQLLGLTNCLMLANDPLVPLETRLQLAELRKSYLTLKRHHKSDIIMSTFIEAISWRKFVKDGNVSGNINKNTNSTG